jgi:hypothetical protein
MPDLILGPVLRHLGTDDATVWVETDAPCEVEVLGHGERTFTVAGHHYALVRIENLRPREVHPYDVRLDGHRVWPPPRYDFPTRSRRRWCSTTTTWPTTGASRAPGRRR